MSLPMEDLYEEEGGEEENNVYRVTKRNNILSTYGNTHTMNLNGLVLENVVQSQYYKNVLSEYSLYQQICDEAYYNVGHLEPWERGTRKTQGMTGMCGGVRGVGAGGIVSTAFCCLYKFHTIKLTRKQLIGLVNSRQSPYLRGLGFMYIRYTQAPGDLWNWFEPYFEDEEEIDPRSGGGDKMTFGNMVRLMLTKLDWYGTLFPRIPVPIQKQIDENFAEKRRAAMKDMERDKEDRGRKRPAEESTREHRSREEVPPKKVMKTRCGHHLRHHHCLKHRKECPKKAKEARAKREREEAEKEMAEARAAASKDADVAKPVEKEAEEREEEQKNGGAADVHMGDSESPQNGSSTSDGKRSSESSSPSTNENSQDGAGDN